MVHKIIFHIEKIVSQLGWNNLKNKSINNTQYRFKYVDFYWNL